MKELISQGAEAKLFRDGNLIIKDRIPKNYRIKNLDEKIRKLRTRREINILEKVSKIISAPQVHKISSEKEFKIIMDYIEGKKLSECLDSFNDIERIKICMLIGKNIAMLHNNHIIHGDLTTSNMILKNEEIYFIDFGLSFIDQKIEHKAVDLHLLKQALESKHYKHFESSFEAVLNGYKKTSKEYEQVLDRLDKVEGRGRYKSKKKKHKALKQILYYFIT